MIVFVCHMLGSDGTVSFWDKDARTRMKSECLILPSCPPSILVSAFFAGSLASPRCRFLGFLLVSSLVTPFAPHRPVFPPLNRPRDLPPYHICACTYSLNSPAFNALPSPVVSASFNHTGTVFAYAAAYDWSKGHEGNSPSQWNKVLLHACKEDEVKKRPPKPGMGSK